MMKLQKLKMVAITLAMVSLGSCGIKNEPKKEAQIKDAIPFDAGGFIYRSRPSDENTRYVLGNFSSGTRGQAQLYPEYLGFVRYGQMGNLVRIGSDGYINYGPYINQGPGIVYAEIDIEVRGRDANIIVDFTSDTGNNIIDSRVINASLDGTRQTIRFNSAISENSFKDLEVRVSRGEVRDGREAFNPSDIDCDRCGPLKSRPEISPGYLNVKVFESRIYHIEKL